MLSYKCPLCDDALQLQEKSLRCANNHCFDIAREGYVNLHTVQEKKSREPGDNQEMLRARQQFLEAGYYHFLADDLVQRIAGLLKLADAEEDEKVENPVNKKRETQNSECPIHILDMGCGEGYYLHQLEQQLEQQLSQHLPPHIPSFNLHGIDIAKYGVRLAAKRKMAAQLAVASAFKLPYFNDSFAALLSVFSPISANECLRVLKPNGVLLMVGPAEHHLSGLVEQIYEQKQAHAGNFTEIEECSNFVLLDRWNLQQSPTISGKYLPNLLKMTPYYWHSSPQQQQSLAELSSLEVLLQFDLRLYQKR